VCLRCLVGADQTGKLVAVDDVAALVRQQAGSRKLATGDRVCDPLPVRAGIEQQGDNDRRIYRKRHWPAIPVSSAKTVAAPTSPHNHEAIPHGDRPGRPENERGSAAAAEGKARVTPHKATNDGFYRRFVLHSWRCAEKRRLLGSYFQVKAKNAAQINRFGLHMRRWAEKRLALR
jgi:hypothetical protein